tara:strand:+ start:3853 stop:4293 length:441 start_codon:yes stop_codon:yes gene_type:complete
MSVRYTNNWKNILTALKSKIRAEMKCPVYSDWFDEIKANQFIRIIPTGSNQLEKATFMEQREYEMSCQYYFLNRKDKQFQNYVLNQVSILEALVHDNMTLTLSDEQNSRALDVTLGDLEFNVDIEDYDDYFVCQWTLTCIHFSNME